MRAFALPFAVVAAGLAAVALLDPERAGWRFEGLLFAAAALLLDSRPAIKVLSALVVVLAIASRSPFMYGADSINYYAYLRSVTFDGDLDFANEWRAWGLEPAAITSTGLRANAQSVGPALVWSPFFLLAHLYVIADRAFGAASYAADGFSEPYKRSTALGTLTVVVLGAWLLSRALRHWIGVGAARLAALGALLASPVLYYALASPMMAHGVEFGVAAALVFALVRAREVGSRLCWVGVGVCYGLLVAVRWQAAVYGLLALPLVLLAWRARHASVSTLASGLAVAGVLPIPQLLAWREIFGSYLTMPQGSGFVDWSSPHLADVLFSANHGLFNWTPVMLVGAVGLLLGLRRDPAFHVGAIAVCWATAWINGGIRDWAGGDAFGARRFALIVPLLAVGLGHVVSALTALSRRSPQLLPCVLLVGAMLWNVGFVAAFRESRFPDAAPLERVAAAQGRVFRLAAQALLDAVAGPPGRALAYDVLSGEYLFTSFNTNGTLTLADLPQQELLGRWSPRRRLPSGVTFRWALGPRSCVRVPLQEPFDLRALVTVRAPRDWQPQAMEVSINGQALTVLPVGTEWAIVETLAPARFQVPGENWLCLRFTNAGREEDGPRAAVSRIQILAASR